ncbi:MAG: diguanylate cyclase [Thermoleophilaceae bacterium]
MSFRSRLRFFFALIVVLPISAMAAVVFPLTEGSEDGKVDAGLAVALQVASSLYAEGRAAAKDDLRRIARDEGLQTALRGGDRVAAASQIRRLAGADASAVSILLLDPSGGEVAFGGSRRGVAPAPLKLTASDGRRMGVLAVSVTDARRLSRSASRRTGLDVAVLRSGKPVAGTRQPATRRSGEYRAAGRTYRARFTAVGKTPGAAEEIVAVSDVTAAGVANRDRRLVFGAILLGLLLAALASSIAVSRALHLQIDAFLEAARRLAGGRFDRPVATKGNDEFAQLGREFNSMSGQLEAKIIEVQRKHEELGETIRRVGEAFATGLDSQSVFRLVIETAVDACQADCGRGLALDNRVLEAVEAGKSHTFDDAIERAERVAVEVGPQTASDLLEVQSDDAAPAEQHEPILGDHDGVHTLSMPLRARLGERTDAAYIAVISIARESHPFSREEAELLAYLGGQAVVSIENADLHETVRRQAVTDELTGLSNVREMHSALDRELGRGRRHDTPVGFVLLDIDNFKRVNDTYGHQQGDEVLRAVSRVLREHSRDIDEPARYGGEELALVLPQTDLDGAQRVAERIRSGIEAIRLILPDEAGELRVTASLGAASVPGSASEKDLIAAADVALFRAKRAGKNRVERAEEGALVV